jgi:hypothetical protein
MGVECPGGLVTADGLDFVVADADVVGVEEDGGGVGSVLRLEGGVSRSVGLG